jgi:hypothetical protein
VSLCERGSILTAGCLAAALITCGGRRDSAESGRIAEASGVAVSGNALLIVDDSAPNAYFRVPVTAGAGPLIPLNHSRPERIPLRSVGPWVDLEAIETLADGRVVLLSERLRSLIGTDGVIAEYDYPLTEFGRRGLEGLACRPLPGGGSRLAVLWEGGYPDPVTLHPMLERTAGGKPLAPLVFVHDLAPGATTGRVPWTAGVLNCTLRCPVPEGPEPEAQRFRAPDLVWYRWPGAQSERWGFLVLLSSQNAVPRPRYLHHWLQRFDLEGQPAGEALDLETCLPADIAHANWEGIHWWQEGRSLVLVHEGSAKLEPNAFLLPLPEDWRYSPAAP